MGIFHKYDCYENLPFKACCYVHKGRRSKLAGAYDEDSERLDMKIED
jgi:hypothetical protein